MTRTLIGLILDQLDTSSTVGCRCSYCESKKRSPRQKPTREPAEREFDLSEDES